MLLNKDLGKDDVGRAPKGVNDGNGFVFISHTGDVYPSGFLPVTAGNVRRKTLVEIYRDSPMFRALRNPDGYRGKCGWCEFRFICGGSRARAFAVTGDYLESEPFCVHIPDPRRTIGARGLRHAKPEDVPSVSGAAQA
jgi:radical SAM protein with 4Fe4S-binding SPASM domain